MDVIHVSHVHKVYKFYRKPSLRLWEAVLRKPLHIAFPALHDISFTLQSGSTLGIIGDNGSGKSTLLKLLAKTLHPTVGSLYVKGRVSALLELGSGFHPEFTGRQNIYLNASLMGMSDGEIRKKEDEIIEFADIGDFIDRPIRSYSSGMVVRLGFAIATCVDPDILIVDEALSVGDQKFQEKCIDRMKKIKESGTTIVFCSHSMYMVNELCNECIWLNHGKIREIGFTEDVVSSYLAYIDENLSINEPEEYHKFDINMPEVVVDNIELYDNNKQKVQKIHQFEPFIITVYTTCFRESFEGHLAIVLEDQQGVSYFAALTRSHMNKLVYHEINKVSLYIPNICLQRGSIWIKAIISDSHALRVIDEKRIGPMTIVSKNPEFGLIWMEHEWIV